VIQGQIPESVHELRICDQEVMRDWIRARQQTDADGHDEVWEGVYVVPPLATNSHQSLVAWLLGILFNVVTLENRGTVYPGANVSDREDGWSHSFRAPDIVVVLQGGRAVDCGTHWWGGPDFLTEVRSSPGDVVNEKLPFYGKIGVGELLVVDRDSRDLTLFHHQDDKMVVVKPIAIGGKKWLASQVLPLAFRRYVHKSGPRIEVIRTDGQPGRWSF
jgi:Uma2 family endonuclease